MWSHPRVGTPIEFANVTAEAHVEHNPAKDISLDQNKSGQAERPSESALVMIEFGREQNRSRRSVLRSLCVGGGQIWLFDLKDPPRHPENGRRDATPGDFIGVPGVPSLGRSEARFAFRISEDFRRIAEFLDLLDDSPFELIEILGQPRVGRQANVYAAGDWHKIF